MVKDIVSTLDPTIARRVLLKLLEKEPELNASVATAIEEVTANPELEDLTAQVEGALSRVTEGAIYGNSGRSSRGYKEPGEAAAELVSDSLQRFFERLEQLSKEDECPAALTLCKAIVLALYHFKDGAVSLDPDEGLEDISEDSADWAARIWRSGGNLKWAGDRRFKSDRNIPRDFVEQHVPEWDWLLSED